MTRRIAIALSLGITVVVMYAMVVIGAQGGLFGEGAGKATADTGLATGDLSGIAGAGQTTAVVTEYIYLTPSPSGIAAAGATDGGSATRTETRSASHDDDEDDHARDGKHHDEEDDD